MNRCEYIKKPYDSYEAFLLEKYWKKNMPLNIHFELTNKCNEKCIHCLYTKDKNNELSTYISLVYKRVL